jgi:hypothetical protein
MGFQAAVNLYRGFGIVGEKFSDAPAIATSYILNGTQPNQFGNAFTLVSEGVAQAGGDGVFVGILVNPKAHILTGTAGDPLAPSLILPNQTQADLATRGQYIDTLSNAGNIGDLVAYSTTDGSLQSVAPIVDFTASISTTVLTVSAVAKGTLGVGQIIEGAGVIPGTYIISLGTGTGGTGTYNISGAGETVASKPMTANSLAPTGYKFIPKAEVFKFDTSASGLAVVQL